MLGLSLHAWEEITVFALGITAVAAFALVVATRIVISLQRESIRESDVKVAEARESAAKANERAAQLELTAEEERHARLKLEEKLAPRKITQEQQYAMQAKLRPLGAHKVFLASAPVTTEGERLIRTLGAAFPDDWPKVLSQPAPLMPLWPGGILVGYAADTDEPVARAISDAIKAAGIAAYHAPSMQGMGAGGLIVRPKEIWVIIGEKP